MIAAYKGLCSFSNEINSEKPCCIKQILLLEFKKTVLKEN